MPEPIETPDPDVLTDTRDLNTLNTFISSQSCVLLLGPLFGVDANSEKIHSNLRSFLTAEPNLLNLDDEFDNLYICKSPDSTQNAILINGLDSYYKTVQPHQVYSQILSIGFRAIISYTSDLLLAEANTNNEYDFAFFSAKGNQINPDQGTALNATKKPLIYNIFGNNSDLNSLITDYDSLYDFLINILQANQEFPLQLKNILSSARAFLFLGFDLRKWYIPLIIRKFNHFILNGNRTRTAVSAFACLDDTDDIQADLLAEGLSKYPLSFTAFKGYNSLQLLEKLAMMPKKVPVVALGNSRPVSQTELAFFKKWDQEMKTYGKEEGLKTFFKEYKDLNYSGVYKIEFDGKYMDYNKACTDKYFGTISREDFDVACNIIVLSLFEYIPKVLNP